MHHIAFHLLKGCSQQYTAFSQFYWSVSLCDKGVSKVCDTRYLWIQWRLFVCMISECIWESIIYSPVRNESSLFFHKVSLHTTLNDNYNEHLISRTNSFYFSPLLWKWQPRSPEMWLCAPVISYLYNGKRLQKTMLTLWVPYPLKSLFFFLKGLKVPTFYFTLVVYSNCSHAQMLKIPRMLSECFVLVPVSLRSYAKKSGLLWLVSPHRPDHPVSAWALQEA